MHAEPARYFWMRVGELLHQLLEIEQFTVVGIKEMRVHDEREFRIPYKTSDRLAVGNALNASLKGRLKKYLTELIGWMRMPWAASFF
ncbi:hypothetical protein BamMEX5DRAFT_6993 [Burkholderia ambifaria MEX-5]|uniref:Uncharacterized protein n=1 Tax=Burkholderia ambifaria MEX-5 TaxID=396597 RepID=B1TGS7_9BURK|nr:hypothetical protein BamMEX5DRAFT_6993 [Burkholderia ambifaria MEX-5]